LEANCDPDIKDTEYGWTALSWAAGHSHEGVVRLLLTKGVDLVGSDYKGRTPLSWTYILRKGHANVVQFLLDNGAELILTKSMLNRHPLMWAVMEGNADVVKVLLSQDVNLKLQDPMTGETPLLWAAGSDHETMAMLLLGGGAD
ncbi:ankyrin, partial [Aspergillus sclerotioniger CBS 115572]